MKTYTCKHCQYFHQHYTLDKKHIFRVYCGHCTYRKVRNKSPEAKVCDGFLLAEPKEAAFATKEYLSKELLQYLLNLELLPKIEDAPQNTP